MRNSRFFEEWDWWFNLTSGDGIWINKKTGEIMVEYRNSELFEPTEEDQKKEIALQPFIDNGFVYKCTLKSGRRVFYNQITNEWGKEQIYLKPIAERTLPAIDTLTKQEKTEAQVLLLENAKKEWEQLEESQQVILTKLAKKKEEMESMLTGQPRKQWKHFVRVQVQKERRL